MGGLGLDYHGQPIRLNSGLRRSFEQDHPLHFNPIGSGCRRQRGAGDAVDHPFTMEDAEELLHR